MESVTKFTLYVGLNDKDSKLQEISTLDACKIISNIATSHCGGATISETTGIYTHENGTIIIEKSLRVEILFATTDQIKMMVTDIKRALNQESVAVQKEIINSELW